MDNFPSYGTNYQRLPFQIFQHLSILSNLKLKSWGYYYHLLISTIVLPTSSPSQPSQRFLSPGHAASEFKDPQGSGWLTSPAEGTTFFVEVGHGILDPCRKTIGNHRKSLGFWENPWKILTMVFSNQVQGKSCKMSQQKQIQWVNHPEFCHFYWVVWTTKNLGGLSLLYQH